MQIRINSIQIGESKTRHLERNEKRGSVLPSKENIQLTKTWNPYGTNSWAAIFAPLDPLPTQVLDPHFHYVGICLQICLFSSDFNVDEKIKGF
jgi:hypothetical protein